MHFMICVSAPVCSVVFYYVFICVSDKTDTSVLWGVLYMNNASIPWCCIILLFVDTAQCICIASN